MRRCKSIIRFFYPLLLSAVIISCRLGPPKPAGDVEDVPVALNTRSDSVREFRRKGMDMLDGERFMAAIREFDKAIELDSTDVSSLFYLGFAKFKTGDLKGARYELDRAIAINPANAAFYARRGMDYDAMGSYQQAKADLDKALDINPADAEFHFYRGEIAWHINDSEAACREWRISDNAGYKEARERLDTYCR